MNLKAFDNKNKRWLDSFMITPNGMVVIRQKQGGWQNFKDVVVDATLCRGTGLKDKNGVEIFEFDIVKFYNEYYKIVFENGSFYMVRKRDGFCKILHHYLDEVKVIRTIFDTPHLLEAKQ